MDNNKPVIWVAWTFDDGPFSCTPDLIAELQARNIFAATWFVARHRVHMNNYFECLNKLQQSGSEIGIHEIHPVEDAINWFPRSHHCFSDIRQAVTSLKEYLIELEVHGIIPRFVRLPGGEISELMQYLRILNCPAHYCMQTAMNIIKGQKVPVEYIQAKEDFEYFLSSLQQMNLTVWSGAPKGYRLLGDLHLFNSWQAESAGIAKGRGDDNITLHQAPQRKLAGIRESNAGIFEQKIRLALRTGQSQSVVVLAHDRSELDVKEITEDIDTMLAYSRQYKVDIHFCTLSKLYNEIR